jgi:hypothetical protein
LVHVFSNAPLVYLAPARGSELDTLSNDPGLAAQYAPVAMIDYIVAE